MGRGDRTPPTAWNRRHEQGLRQGNRGRRRDLPDDAAALPAGVKNYITPQGLRDAARRAAASAHASSGRRWSRSCRWAAGNGDRSENGDYLYGKKRLREIDRRIRFLTKRIEIAEVVDPAQQKNRDQAFFGATVTYAGEDGAERTVRIVGIDEADLSRGEVSWISPIAKALLKAREGDTVAVRTPHGPETVGGRQDPLLAQEFRRDQRRQEQRRPAARR